MNVLQWKGWLTHTHTANSGSGPTEAAAVVPPLCSFLNVLVWPLLNFTTSVHKHGFHLSFLLDARLDLLLIAFAESNLSFVFCSLGEK